MAQISRVLGRAGVAGAVIVGGGFIASAPSAAASGASAARPHRCITMDHLSETTVLYSELTPNGPYPSVGDSAVFTDNIYNSAGKQIITVNRTANVPYRKPNGHYIEFGHEQLSLADGTIDAGGLFDITDGLAGKWLFVTAVGTGGRYLGLVGKRWFRIPGPNVPLEGKIELCQP